jgi:outer membrane immunogenic protein
MKATTLLALALAALPVLAGAADGGIYLGAGAGRGRIQNESVGFDSKGTAYKGFVGYRFGGLPLIDVALEAGYTDFGHPAHTTPLGSVEYKLRGATAAGLLILPLGPIDLFGKAGAIRLSSEKTIGGTTTSKTSTNGLYGAGIGFRLWKLGMRAEYEYFDVKGVERAAMASVSAVFQF